MTPENSWNRPSGFGTLACEDARPHPGQRAAFSGPETQLPPGLPSLRSTVHSTVAARYEFQAKRSHPHTTTLRRQLTARRLAHPPATPRTGQKRLLRSAPVSGFVTFCHSFERNPSMGGEGYYLKTSLPKHGLKAVR